MTESLDKRSLSVTTKQGKQKTVPALHIGFAVNVKFVPYELPPVEGILDKIDDDCGAGQALLEEWKEKIHFLQEDLHWLLRLSHQRFWCQVVYDESLHECLESYLSLGPRCYDPYIANLPLDVAECLHDLHKAVFLVYLRMSTYKESKENHISPKAFGEILYDNYLFDIPKMMDLCVLYGAENHALLHKMLNNIFEVQPQYEADLCEAVPTILKVFLGILEQLDLKETRSESENGPTKLRNKLAPTHLGNMEWPILEDCITYLVDTSATLSAFFDVYPVSALVFHQENIAPKISNFYEKVFPPLDEELKFRAASDDHLRCEEVRWRLSYAKSCLVQAFRQVLVSCCIQPLLETSSHGEKGDRYVDDFLDILAGSLSDKHFICRYQGMYPFEDDIETLHQAKCTIDPTRTDYLLNSIYAAFSSTGNSFAQYDIGSSSKKKPSGKPNNNVQATSNGIAFQPDSASSQNVTLTNGELSEADLYIDYSSLDGACAAPKKAGVELESLISHVQDVFPDLGEGFIEECLDYYSYDAEKVIGAVLEGFPACLAKLNKNMPRRAAAPVKEEPSVLSERRNIYDNDEFDVFSRETVDTTRIHKGKREKDEDTATLFNNKNHLKSLKGIYDYHGNVEEVTDPTVYDDEYDDTYDTLDVGLKEPAKEDELLARRPFVTPRVLRQGLDDEEDEAEEESPQEETSTSQSRPRDQFVPNPEEQRKARELHRNAVYANASHKQRDVKGKARGQGQPEDTLRNRKYKERHKGSSANHNRRSQGDWKRSRGMIPM